MGQVSRMLLVVALAVVTFGCAQKSGAPLEEQQSTSYIRQSKEAILASAAKENNPAGKEIVSKAKSAIGTPYVLGGSTPGGFDCSGLVKWSYSHIGVTLPRTAREQSVVGEKIHKVEDMKAGDIVAFRHPKRGYHTGIYMGDGKFIHSPRKKTRVRINNLSDPYFRETLLGARRVNVEAGENLVAQAQARLDAAIAEKTKLTVSSKNMRAVNSHKKASTQTAKAGKNIKTAAATKKSQKVASSSKSKVSGQKKEVKQGAVKGSSSSKQTASKKTVKNSKTVAQNNPSKKKQTVSVTKKTSHKEVSMLNKKSASKQAVKRKHS